LVSGSGRRPVQSRCAPAFCQCNWTSRARENYKPGHRGRRSCGHQQTTATKKPDVHEDGRPVHVDLTVPPIPLLKAETMSPTRPEEKSPHRLDWELTGMLTGLASVRRPASISLSLLTARTRQGNRRHQISTRYCLLLSNFEICPAVAGCTFILLCTTFISGSCA